MKDNLMIRLMTAMILIGIGLAHFSGQTNLLTLNWLWLAIMPAFMGFQATFTGWCPAELVGKLSKTGECCPGGTCGTKPQTAVKEQTNCCATPAQSGEIKQQNSCCGSDSEAENKKDTSCCGGEETPSTSNCCGNAPIEIKVLGTGCATCTNTVKLIESTAQEQGVAVNVIKVEDIAEIAAYGIMSTPGIVIKDQVVHSGGMPNKKMIIEWLS
jgi:small redox-active disulfide protein 2